MKSPSDMEYAREAAIEQRLSEADELRAALARAVQRNNLLVLDLDAMRRDRDHWRRKAEELTRRLERGDGEED